MVVQVRILILEILDIANAGLHGLQQELQVGWLARFLQGQQDVALDEDARYEFGGLLKGELRLRILQ